MLSAFLALSIALVSCSAFPVNNKTVQGRYDLKGDWFAGEYIVLSEKEFEYGKFTDVVGLPQMEKFPVKGKYTLDGCLLTLHHHLVDSPHRIITPHNGRFVILKPGEADLFLQTGRISMAALYQGPLNSPN